MKNLQLFELDSIDNIITPEDFKLTTLESPAINIFTDFKEHKALIIEGETKAVDAINLMAKAHVQMKIVVNNTNDFAGVITTKELSEQNIVAEVAKGVGRSEILVRDMMLPRENLYAFDINEIKNAKVQDVLVSLKNYKLSHCLVVDRQNHHIRGVISSSDVARKLHLPMTIDTKSSFNEVLDLIK